MHAESFENGQCGGAGEGIQLHIEQTEIQIERVEQAMETLDIRPGRKVCEAMRGLVEEATHEIGEQDGKGPILDLVIVASMQRIEHYEIAAYGTDIALAKALGETEVVKLLRDARGGKADRSQADGSDRTAHHAGGHERETRPASKPAGRSPAAARTKAA